MTNPDLDVDLEYLVEIAVAVESRDCKMVERAVDYEVQQVHGGRGGGLQ